MPSASRPDGDRGREWTLFGHGQAWQGDRTPGLDRETGEPVLPEDHNRAYWRRHGHGGTGRIICLNCWYGHAPGIEAGTTVALIYREATGRKPHFAHPAGRAHDSLGDAGESVWHLQAKRHLDRWAAQQDETIAVHQEWTVPGGTRRADVRATSAAGASIVLEAQQRALTPTQWHERRQSYARLTIRDYWFWPTTVQHPSLTADGLTSFAIDSDTDADNERLGLIVNLLPSSDRDVPTFRWPADRWRPLAALWAPMREWAIVNSTVRPPPRLVAQCQPPIAATACTQPAPRRPPRPTPRAAPARPGDTRPVCVTCRLPLDPILADVGRHIGC